MAGREDRQVQQNEEEDMEAEAEDVRAGEQQDEGRELVALQQEQFEVMEAVLVDDEDSVEEYYQSCDDRSHDDSDGASASEEEGSREHYDTSLPSRHVYLGETEELRGCTVVEEDEAVTLPLLLHSSLMNLVLVPSQTLPLSVFHPLHISLLRSVIARDRIFGIVHSKILADGTSEIAARYGTTAEIYEYQEEESNGMLCVKAKGRQRFRVLSTHRESSGLHVARVKILPEIRMGNPFDMMRLQSLDKLTLPSPEEATSHVAQARNLRCVRTENCWRVRGRNAWLSPWPPWVYDQYDDLLLAQRVVNEIKRSTTIETSRVKLPCDPQDLSHWAAINLPLDNSHRLALLSLDTPTQRLRYILSVLSKCKMLTCTQCSEVIGDTADIFSMSVEGPQGTFVNPVGYVHEMLTLTKATNLIYYGRPSTAHSWFPGYAWTIANCHNCHTHMGWKFTATKRKVKPQKFYGVTRKAVTAKLVWEGHEDEQRHVI